MEKNLVTSRYMALVNGQITYLAGCNNRQCDKPCLRKDLKLSTRVVHNRHNAKDCRHFIPLEYIA